MLNSIRRTLRDLRAGNSGNATLLVALGMPVLIGGSGLAVDTAQWYMWKREIQYAADQAALAGAWARSHEDSESVYVTRARQEFTSNVSTTSTISSTPNVRLADYNGGDDNSVIVEVSASRTLPFSNFVTGRTVTVNAFAQASFTDGTSYTACLIATDEDDAGAITIGGSATLTAACGLAALSTSDQSVIINGNPNIDPGWVVSAGGIDDWLSNHTDAEINEYMNGLSDPFAELTTPTPNPNPAQTYACVEGGTRTTGDRRTKTDIFYTYWRGRNASSASEINNYTGSGYLADVTGSWGTWSIDILLAPNSVDGVTQADAAPTFTQIGGSGNSKVYRRAVVRTHTEIANAETIITTTQATLNQGTYTGGFQTRCNTVFNPGVYVINGGEIRINAQHQVTGAGVLIVLKNGATLHINGGASINLTAATSAQLMNIGGLSASQATQFAGMLVFEDRASQGGSSILNGTANTILNGKIYLPKSDITFSGTAGVTSACLLIAASNITLTGTTDMSTFCPPGMTNTDEVTSGQATIKLVA